MNTPRDILLEAKSPQMILPKLPQATLLEAKLTRTISHRAISLEAKSPRTISPRVILLESKLPRMISSRAILHEAISCAPWTREAD